MKKIIVIMFILLSFGCFSQENISESNVRINKEKLITFIKKAKKSFKIKFIEAPYFDELENKNSLWIIQFSETKTQKIISIIEDVVETNNKPEVILLVETWCENKEECVIPFEKSNIELTRKENMNSSTISTEIKKNRAHKKMEKLKNYLLKS